MCRPLGNHPKLWTLLKMRSQRLRERPGRRARPAAKRPLPRGLRVWGARLPRGNQSNSTSVVATVWYGSMVSWSTRCLIWRWLTVWEVALCTRWITSPRRSLLSICSPYEKSSRSLVTLSWSCRVRTIYLLHCLPAT